jgi:hypothetical protein
MSFLMLLVLAFATDMASSSAALQALRASANTTLHSLTNHDARQKAQRIRQEAVKVLLANPAESFPMLVKFVSEAASKEQTALQGDEEAAASYLVASAERGDFLAKYDACNVIALLYSRLNDF